MAIKKKFRSINCTRKIGWPNQEAARAAINRAWRIGNWRGEKGARPLRAYKCNQCDFWHTTSKGPRTNV